MAKNGQVAWDAVMGFDLAPFLSGQNVAPNALGALDDLSRQLEEARIEPDPGVNPETNADRLARLAVVLQLSSEYQAMRAEDLQVAVEKKDRELDVMDEQMEQLERGGAMGAQGWNDRPGVAGDPKQRSISSMLHGR